MYVHLLFKYIQYIEECVSCALKLYVCSGNHLKDVPDTQNVNRFSVYFAEIKCNLVFTLWYTAFLVELECFIFVIIGGCE